MPKICYILCLGLCLFLSACDGKKNDSSATIAALISDIGNPYWKTFYDGLSETAHELNETIDIYTLKHATDSEGQLNQCETALLKKPKILLFAAVNSVNLGPCLRKANAQNILLIDVDGNVDQKLAKQMDVNLAFSVASNNYELGKSAANYIDNQKGKVLILEGTPGSQPGILRVKGFKENLSKNLRAVASLPGNWDRLKGGEITSQMLTAHSDLAVIFAANDTMAIGAIEAIRAANREGIIVTGIDGTADAIQAIKSDRLTASIAQLPYLMGRQAVIKSLKQLAGEETYNFHQYVPIIALDKDVLKNKKNKLFQYLR